ncbi:c-type cytochrome [Draconibacterium sp. IB214405]|uniref:c-type cytochrome n=1 Tax=Draconibacterium sp. IB214405 TaxID=3097352 RepID=UPI002A0FF9FB|nr:c-type cytochrome [Draconibacterium sp. IB214405]MDX8339873.1 c-type cytochrome [Draconibacterium sp. IB214405]
MRKNKFVLLIFGAFCLALVNFSCTNGSKSTVAEAEPTELSGEELVARGEYLVTIMGCNDCHSPKRVGANGPELIPELLLSGYPGDRPILDLATEMTQQGFATFYPDLTGSAGPWGMSFAANLTPDATGIGTWSEEQFKKAMKEGKFKGLDGTRPLLPPMPSENFKDIKDEDVSAIFAYLKSLTPVKNVVPAAIPPGEM